MRSSSNHRTARQPTVLPTPSYCGTEPVPLAATVVLWIIASVARLCPTRARSSASCCWNSCRCRCNSFKSVGIEAAGRIADEQRPPPASAVPLRAVPESPGHGLRVARAPVDGSVFFGMLPSTPSADLGASASRRQGTARRLPQACARFLAGLRVRGRLRMDGAIRGPKRLGREPEPPGRHRSHGPQPGGFLKNSTRNQATSRRAR